MEMRGQTLKTNKPFLIQDWVVDPNKQRVFREKQEIILENLMMKALLALAEKAPNILTKEEMTQVLWGDIAVCDNSLIKVISKLRAIFDDDPVNPKFIETVRKRGYRLMICPQNLEAKPTQTLRDFKRKYLFMVTVLIGVVLIAFYSGEKTTQNRMVVEPLTSLPGRESMPRWSPDGKKLAYFSDRENRQLYLNLHVPDSPKSSRQIQVGSGFGNVCWSPDGQSLALVDKSGDNYCLWLVDARSGKKEKLVEFDPNPILGLDWDAKRQCLWLSKLVADGGAYGIFQLDLTTFKMKPFCLPNKGEIGYYEPLLSQDAESLAMIHVLSSDQTQLAIYNFATEKLETLDFNRLIYAHAWGPKNSHFLVSVNQQMMNIFTQAGGEWVSLLPSGHYAPFSLDFADGKLVFEHNRNDYDIFSFRSGQPNQVSRSTFSEFDASFSNGQVAFISNRSGTRQVWVRNLESGEEKQLTDINEGIVRGPRLSADGKRLAFIVWNEDQDRLMVLNPESKTLSTRLKMSGIRFLSCWSGSQILVNVKTDRFQGVISVEPSGDFKPYLQDAIKVFEAAGRTFFNRLDQNAIYERVADGNSEFLTEAPGLMGSGWVVHQNQLYYVDLDHILWQIDLSSLEKTSLAQLNKSDNLLANMDVDPQTGTLYFGALASRDSDLFILPWPQNQ